MNEFIDHLGQFVTAVLATACALALIALALYGVRKFWRGPVEPVGFLEWVSPTGRPSAAVNVEYRGRDGGPMDLGPLIKARLRNGRGAVFELSEGCFIGCDAKRIKAASACVVAVADGLVVEHLRVKVDLERQTLFVQSQLTLAEIIERINATA